MEFGNVEKNKSDYDEILGIYKKYINYGEGAIKEFDDAFWSEKTFGVKCVDDGKIVGVFLIEDAFYFTGNEVFLKEQILEDINHEKIMVGPMLAVLNEYQGKGIGGKLITMGYDEMRKVGCHHLLLDMWKYPDGRVPSEMFLRYSSSYKLYGEFENYYRKLESKKYYCPICKENCICTMKLYVANF